MNEQTANTEKKTYRNAPLPDREYFAKPRWHEVAVNEKSGNLVLTVLWDVCDKDGHPGCYDMENGTETPRPADTDSWEAVSNTYVIAFADEAKNLAKCKGKDLEYLKDVCPKTYERMKNILKWCPNWDVKRVMWFTDNREEFYSTIVRITVVHEEWNGAMRAKAKWTNPKERAAKEVDTSETRQKITSAFGGFFDVTASAPAPKTAAPKANPTSAQVPAAPKDAPAKPASATKADAWAAYCKTHEAHDASEWYAMIKGFGKKEAEFTPADWAKLRQDILDLPF